MDRELKNLMLNINQLATIAGICRQTAAARLQNIQPAGGHDKLKLYRVADIVSAFLALPPPVAEGEMDAHERKAWYQSERERLKFEQETAQLIPASDVRREFAIWAKAVVQVLETLPDVLERDCGLQPTAVSRVQSIIDDLRDQIALRVTDIAKGEIGDGMTEGVFMLPKLKTDDMKTGKKVYPPIRAGDICVTETDKPDTLNAFLDAPTEADLRPEVMKQFEEMLKEAIRVAGEVESNRHASEEAANSARQSEQNASKHAAEAGKAAEQSGSNAQATASARDDSQRYAMSAAASAESAERSEREATECASSASQSASSAALSASTATEKELGAGNHASSAKESKTAAELAAERATSAAQNAAADAATQLRNEVREEIDRASGLAERAEAANEGAWQALAEAQEIAKTPGPPGDKGDKGD
ncbi:TPA: DUF1441 family protein, partial [Escherichia coli]|nr:DUF1441 family protein [Escherichia coli]